MLAHILKKSLSPEGKPTGPVICTSCLTICFATITPVTFGGGLYRDFLPPFGSLTGIDHDQIIISKSY